MRLACGELWSWLEKGATIVTPTPFLAGVAIEQFTRERLRSGVETWDRPAIFGVEAWLETCWREARYSSVEIPTLLSAAQERALWHGIIEREHPHLFDVSATVGLARAAASLLAEWDIPAEGRLWNDHADAQQFQRWSRSLKDKCRENRWMTRADLAREVSGLIKDGTLRPGLTAFAGFERVSPAVASIQHALGAACVRAPFDDEKPAKAVAKQFDDFGAEVEFAARRLRYLFDEKPGRSLALFVPELAEQHALVRRVLHAVFFPSIAAKITDSQTTAPAALFRFSSGSLLIDHPLVASALLFLNLAVPQIDHADAGTILRSPFIQGAVAEKHLRALADIELRKRRELDVGLHDLERVSRSCPILSACWSRLQKLMPRASEPRHLSAWCELISDFLGAMGWPGETVLTVREERVVEEWKDQLSTLSGLGLVSPPLTFEAALGHLRRLLSVPLETGEWSSPIQVLDARQAVGVQFDAAIAVGLSEESWPPALRISPLVPLKLQREHHVPGSTPQSARAERADFTKALFRSAPSVVATFSKRLATAAGSFVVRKDTQVKAWEKLMPDESFPLATLEQFPDGAAPAFVAAGEVRGGTGIIRAQSLCPFKAFSEYRLLARGPEDASFGFDARERGGFVHKALENVWRRLESQSKLKATPPAELRALVRESIAEAVNAKDEAGPLHQLSASTERERLEEVILEWLVLEAGRQEPFTVEFVEQAQKYEVPGLSVQLRVDRIDRLKSGNLVLIDYKSGKQTNGKLDGDRPAEPQLLVYAASIGAGIEGVFFGQVKPRDVRAVGYSRKKQFDGRSVKVKKDWDAYMTASHGYVEKLATNFVHGVAEVDPIKGACDYCGSKPFCRINERGAAQQEEEE
jgi:ATP-dependent helicase/nuclease subunit B